MGKLKCLINESLVQDKSHMTHFTLLMSKMEVKEGKLFRRLNDLANLVEWLSVHLRTKWLWVRFPLHTLKLQMSCLYRARSSWVHSK